MRMSTAGGGRRQREEMARRGGGDGREVEVEDAKRAYRTAIDQELQEAARLMNELNQNLCYWAEKTGEVEKMAQVWSMFQNRLASVVGTVASVNQQPDIPQV